MWDHHFKLDTVCIVQFDLSDFKTFKFVLFVCLSIEAASSAIAQYLEIKSAEDDGNGWMLLNSLNLLAAGGQTIVNTMTIAALPSTLVKCLYLFFDLAEVKKGKPKDEEGPELTPYKKRETLQKTVIQVQAWNTYLCVIPVDIHTPNSSYDWIGPLTKRAWFLMESNQTMHAAGW